MNEEVISNQTITNDEMNLGMLAHLCSLLGAFTMGLVAMIGPFVIWLVKKDQSTFVAEHAKEALNFNISYSIYVISTVLGIVAFNLFFSIAMPGFIKFCIFMIILAAIVLFFAYWICTIKAMLRARRGKHYRYPFCIRLIK